MTGNFPLAVLWIFPCQSPLGEFEPLLNFNAPFLALETVVSLHKTLDTKSSPWSRSTARDRLRNGTYFEYPLLDVPLQDRVCHTLDLQRKTPAEHLYHVRFLRAMRSLGRGLPGVSTARTAGRPCRKLAVCEERMSQTVARPHHVSRNSRLDQKSLAKGETV